MDTNTVGSNNSAFGYRALISNTTNNNSAFGYKALASNTVGTNNSAFGLNALASNTIANNNSAFGFYSLKNNTTGAQNNAFGNYASRDNTTGNANSAFGQRALLVNTIGSSNSAFGNYALNSNTTGNRNSAFGVLALASNTIGSNNIAVGYDAGANITTGNKNIIIGYNIDATVATGNGQLNIANLIFATGSFGEGTTVTTGSVGIGFKNPTSTLHLYGSGSNKSVFKVDGGNGTLFEVTDNLSGSLFSVNTIAGLPVLEVFSNNRVVAGKYGANDFVISGSKIGIGTSVPNTAKLHIYDSTNSFTRYTNTTNAGHFVDVGANNGGQSFLFSYGAYPVLIGTNGAERIRVDSTGNVGIGITSPTAKLQLYTGASSNDYFAFKIGDAARTLNYIPYTAGGSYNNASVLGGSALFNTINSTWWIGNHNGPAMRFGSDNAIAFLNGGASINMYISGSGNVGIGTTTPTNGTLQVYNASGNTLSLQKAAGGAALAMGSDTTNYALIESINAGGIRFYTGNGTQTEKLRIDVSGNVGIGTTSPSGKLEVRTNAASTYVFSGTSTSAYTTSFTMDDTASYIGHDSSVRSLTLRTNSTDRLTIKGDGNVGIGTNAPVYLLQVNGSFAATTKSFVINHPDPAKPDKQLVHGVTEGPEHSVFVRGKLTNNNTIDLPDYWPYLVDNNTITVTITPIGSYQQLYVQSVENNTVTIANNNNMPINCYYYVVGERKDIPKLIVQP
jgi:hypothetical protein